VEYSEVNCWRCSYPIPGRWPTGNCAPGTTR